MDKVKLKDIATIVTGGTPSTSVAEYWNNGSIAWLQSGCCQNCYVNSCDKYITESGYKNSATRMMPKDTIMIALTGATAGKIGYLTFEACGNQSITGITPDKEKLLPKYLSYHLINRRKKTLKDCIGGAQAHISQGYVKNIEIDLPNIGTQQKIVEELDCISDIIEKKKEQLKELDNLVKSQFNEMFDNLTNTAKLVDVCKFINGDRGKNYPSGSDIVKKGIPFINAGHLENNSISFSEMNYLTEEKFNLLSSGKVQKNDVLYCLRGSLGKKAIVTFNKGAIASSLVILRPNTEKINPKFLLYTLEQPYIDAQMKNSNNGSSQPNLSAQSVKQYNIILPKIELQNKFADFVENIEKSKNDIKQSIEQTQNLFNERMQHYFGE